MASPQKENGYTPIAHKILEQLSKWVISPDEWRILMIIFRKTYGWDKKIDRISHTQFSEMTGISRNHIPRIINKLLARNIIYRVSPIQGTGVSQLRDGNIISYGFQKDYDKWVRCPLNRGLSPKQDLGVPQSGLKVSPKQGHTKDTLTKETIQKKIYGEFQNVKLSDFEFQKLKETFGDAGTNDRIENLSQYVASKGKKYLNHYATILAWERKNDGTIKGSYGKSGKEKCSKYDGIGTTVET